MLVAMQRYTLQSIKCSSLQFTRMETILKCLLLGEVAKKMKSWLNISAPAVQLTQQTVSLIQPISQGDLPSNWMDSVQSGNTDPNIDPIHMNPAAGRAGRALKHHRKQLAASLYVQLIAKQMSDHALTVLRKGREP